MLGINFSELLLIAVVALVVIGPKELPTVIRHLAAIIREVRAFIGGARAQFHQAAREAGFEDILDGTSTIIDLDGKPQQAYDVRELKTLSSPPPVGGRPGGGHQDSPAEQASPPPQPSPERGGSKDPHE